MNREKQPDTTPFWVDNDTKFYYPDLGKRDKFALSRMFFRWAVSITLFIILATFAVDAATTIIPLVTVGIYFFIIGYILYYYRKRRLEWENAVRIQERARLQTKASHIGSAVHVAGHHALSVNQPVVLALSEGLLLIYSYDSPVPLDQIELNDIQAIVLIAYDNERRPIRGVLDGSAQDLEITINREPGPWVCVFRKMRPVRPVDWYQALKQARY